MASPTRSSQPEGSRFLRAVPAFGGAVVDHGALGGRDVAHYVEPVDDGPGGGAGARAVRHQPVDGSAVQGGGPWGPGGVGVGGV